ncbi:MAG: hypothetical protein JNL87_02925 [Burkholderiaceae bacterium]|nr:hypothetical protein [Burkholderiaceae bacterium]
MAAAERPARCGGPPARLAAGLLAALLAWSGAAHAGDAAAPRLASGIYEGLLLAVDDQGAITGYYSEEQGEGVTKRCSFFLAGQAGAGEVPVKTWRAEVFPGTLQAEAKAVRLTIEQGRDHPGCGAVLLPQIATGLSLTQLEATRWTSLRRIVAARAYFHAAPLPDKRQRAFVVQGDVVAVLARRGDWLQVAYRGAKATSVGWMPAADSVALTPP